jgi:hypothetical protein
VEFRTTSVVGKVSEWNSLAGFFNFSMIDHAAISPIRITGC